MRSRSLAHLRRFLSNPLDKKKKKTHEAKRFHCVSLFFMDTRYINRNAAAAILLFCVIFIFS